MAPLAQPETKWPTARQNILICSCEDTMPLDGSAGAGRGCRAPRVSIGAPAVPRELEKFRAAAAGGEPLIVGCTQEAPLFSEVAGDADRHIRQYPRDRRLVEGRGARGPKMAALLAAAEPAPELPSSASAAKA
jgi:hypothetical protein